MPPQGVLVAVTHPFEVRLGSKETEKHRDTITIVAAGRLSQ